MSIDSINFVGKDLPLEQLQPLRHRYTNLERTRGYKRIMASIKSIGLIEPLCVFPENDRYVILDGFLRFKACQELGAQSVPSLIYPDKEAYTYNKMVNRLSPVQENRMIQKALQTIDRKTIAQTLGMSRLECRLTDRILKALHDDVIGAIEKNLLSKTCAADLVHVTAERQKEIIGEMKLNNEYGSRFVRALILQTPPEQRSGWKGRAAPRRRDPVRKKEMVARLQEAENKHDFFDAYIVTIHPI